MTKRTVEIEDNLDGIIESAKEDVKTLIEDYIEENEEKPDYSDLDYSGEINDLFYLYGDDFEQAFDNAGIGDKDDDHWPVGWKPAAIYCYIEQEILNDLDEMIDELWDKYEESLPKEE